MTRPLFVTRPLLPDVRSMHEMVNCIWKAKFVTNDGPLHQRLEQNLAEYLGVPAGVLFNNGTTALLVALKMFDLTPGSEVITTPLTFAATAHAIAWNNLVPVFADISPGTLTLDPEAVRAAITAHTSAILAVHVYGTVCELDDLQRIAEEHDLRLLYDAAHVFGTTVGGRPIGTFGDVSVFSFHATKLFNTIEGGMITTPRAADTCAIKSLRNFGIKNEEEVVSIGINGKMNELQAAVGLLNLPLVEAEKRRRALLREKYTSLLCDLPGISLQTTQPGVSKSEQYFPIIIDESRFGRSRDNIYDELKARRIFARKYFHPICTDFLPYRGYKIHSTFDTPYVEFVKSRVLCMPFHSEVADEDLAEIAEVFHGGAPIRTR